MIALELAATRREMLGDRSRVSSSPTPPTSRRWRRLQVGATLAHVERFSRRPFEFLGPHAERIDNLRKVIKPSDALFWSVSFAAFGPRSSAKQIDFIYDMLAETPSDVIFDLFKAYRGFNVEDELERDNRSDPFGRRKPRPDHTGRGVRAHGSHVPKAQLEIFDGCGHMTMLEAPREIQHAAGGFPSG